MQVRIEMTGPMASGKTVLANKLVDFIKSEALPGTEVMIREYTACVGEPVQDRRDIRETTFRV